MPRQDIQWRVEAIYQARDTDRRWATLAQLILELVPGSRQEDKHLVEQHRLPAASPLEEAIIHLAEDPAKIIILADRLRQRRERLTHPQLPWLVTILGSEWW